MLHFEEHVGRDADQDRERLPRERRLPSSLRREVHDLRSDDLAETVLNTIWTVVREVVRDRRRHFVVGPVDLGDPLPFGVERRILSELARDDAFRSYLREEIAGLLSPETDPKTRYVMRQRHGLPVRRREWPPNYGSLPEPQERTEQPTRLR